MHCYHLGDYCKAVCPVAAGQVRKAGVIPLHRHDCVELMLVTRGSGVCRINGSPYPVLSGDLFVLCSEDLHSYEMEPECVFYNILFDPAFFASDPELAALFDGWTRRDSRKLYSFGAGEADGLEALAAGLVCELTGGAPGARLLARSLLTDLCARRRRHAGTAGGAAPPPGRMSAVMAYIDRHLAEPVSVRKLAETAGMSPSAFRAAFRRWTGGSATGYISCLRIRRARILLEQRDLPIGEIALQLGYFDACHFSRAFRARTGLSPRQYRARL